MLARLSGVLYRRRRLVWIGAVLFVVVAGGLGTGVQKPVIEYFAATHGFPAVGL